MRTIPLPLLALALLLAQCKKKYPAPPPTDPVAALPTETQSGAHTFGCLLNGQPWTPSGNNGPSNYRITYDPGYAGGSLEIRVYRYVAAINNSQYFTFGGAPITKAGTYPIDGKTCGVYYSTGVKGSCYEYYKAPGLIMRGQLTITKLDLTNNIVAGTFDFQLAQPGCDTVKVTKGRFDYAL